MIIELTILLVILILILVCFTFPVFDESTVGGFILVGVIFLFIVLISILVYSDFGNQERAADKAQQLCLSQGFDVYESFDRIDWTDKPLGVKCNYINNKREILGLDDAQPLVQV